MCDNFEIRGSVTNAHGNPADLSFLYGIIGMLSSRVNIDRPEEFGTDERVLHPKTIFHADFQVSAYAYVGKKEIHIHLGLLLLCQMLGEFEKEIVRFVFKRIPFDEIERMDVTQLTDTIRAALKYIDAHKKGHNKTLVLPELNLSLGIYNLMVTFIYGHELSHYLDDVFDFDLRGKHQMEVFSYGLEYLQKVHKLMKDESFTKYVRAAMQFLSENSESNGGEAVRWWSEEYLADFQSYQFCMATTCPTNVPVMVARLYISISLVFLALRIMELYNEQIAKIPAITVSHPPVLFREGTLGVAVNKKYYSSLDYEEFYRSQWAIFHVSAQLFYRALDGAFDGWPVPDSPASEG